MSKLIKNGRLRLEMVKLDQKLVAFIDFNKINQQLI